MTPRTSRFLALAFAAWAGCATAQQLGTAGTTALDEFLAGLPVPTAPSAAAPSSGDARWLTVEREWAQANDIDAMPALAALQDRVPAAATGNTASATGGGPTVADPRTRRAAAGGPGGRSSGGDRDRVSVGSTSITVSARDITTTAVRGSATTDIGVRQSGRASTDINVSARSVVTQATGGDATTEIGVRDGGGGSTTVSARDTITRSTGGSATTKIGGEAGTVSAGMTYNEGGTLSIGASGITRNGMRCLEIFRQTCIIHIYYRRKSDPCAPGYWMDFRRCLLPSDRKHNIVQ